MDTKIGFGTWVDNPSLKEKRIISVEEAIAIGYRLFDTATIYGTWKELATVIENSGIPREEFYIIHKVHDVPTYELIHEIARLYGGYIDNITYHSPGVFGKDKETFKKNFSEGWSVFEEAKSKGDVKFAGVSNFYFNQLTCAIEVTKGRLPIDSNQIEIHYGTFDKELFNLCAQNGISIVAHTPLGGLFSNQILPNLPNSILKRAEDLELTPASYILNVMVAVGIIPITSSYEVSHILSNSIISENITHADFFMVFDLKEVMPYPMVELSSLMYEADTYM